MNKYLVLDVETTISNKGNPFDPRNKLCVVGILDGDEYSIYNIEHNEDPYGEALKEIQNKILEATHIIGFNIKFDIHWLRRYGITIPKKCEVWDCQIAEYLIANQQIKFPSLNDVCAFYNLGQKLSTIEEEYWSVGIDTPQIPIDVLTKYLKQDLKLTQALYNKQTAIINAKNDIPFTNLVWLHNKDMLVLEEMEFNGLKVDLETVTTLKEEATNEMENLDKEFLELSNIPPTIAFNINSTNHLSCLIFGGFLHYDTTVVKQRTLKNGTTKERTVKAVGKYYIDGFARPDPSTESVLTKKLTDQQLQEKKISRKYSVDFGTLSRIKASTQRGKAIIKLLLRRSNLAQKLETYLEKIPALFTTYNWKHNLIHGQFNQCSTRTGRLSSSNPNLQNFDTNLLNIFISRY